MKTTFYSRYCYFFLSVHVCVKIRNIISSGKWKSGMQRQNRFCILEELWCIIFTLEFCTKVLFNCWRTCNRVQFGSVHHMCNVSHQIYFLYVLKLFVYVLSIKDFEISLHNYSTYTWEKIIRQKIWGNRFCSSKHSDQTYSIIQFKSVLS